MDISLHEEAPRQQSGVEKNPATTSRRVGGTSLANEQALGGKEKSRQIVGKGGGGGGENLEGTWCRDVTVWRARGCRGPSPRSRPAGLLLDAEVSSSRSSNEGDGRQVCLHFSSFPFSALLSSSQDSPCEFPFRRRVA